MKMLGAAGVALVVALVGGCGIYRGIELNRFLGAQVGSNTDTLLMRYGAPTRSAQLSDGAMVYTWERPWTSAGSFCNESGCWPGPAIAHVCRIIVTTDASGIVTRWRYEDC
jgi:hypothetical protein